MTKIIFTILFFLIHNVAVAQQCGYSSYYVFAVNPHLPNSNKKTEGLKMYLVDENNNAITNTKQVLINKSWQHIKDSFYFWDNGKKLKGDYTKPFIRRNFYRVGDNYLVAFRLETHLLKDPLEYPIYKLKVEDQTINKVKIREQYFYLPVKKAVSICFENLYSDYDGYAPAKTLNGKDFKPIDIALNKNQEQQADKNEEKDNLKYAVRFTYTENAANGIETEEYSISGAKIFDTKTGKVNQEIYIPSKSKSVIKESKNIVEFTDFYDRGVVEAKDFSVQIENWRDLKFMVQKEKTYFYIFDTRKKLYQLDTTLSNYNDVFYYQPLKKMKRYDYVATSISHITYTYQLENKKWKIIDKNETLFKPVLPPIKYAPKACVLFKNQYHTLPLQAVIGTNATKLIKDTFWLYNGCDDTVFITKVQSQNKDFFSINQTLLPEKNTPLVFNGLLQSSSFFTNNNYNCYLTLNDSTILSFGIVVPTVSNNSTVIYNRDSTVNYAIAKKQNAKFTTAIFTHPNGNLRAMGQVQDADTTLKVGNWRFFFDGTWGIDEVVYSKAISLSAFEASYGGQHSNFKVKVLEDGLWKQPIVDISNNQQRFFITQKTDSVVAYADSTSYGFKLQYNQMPAETSKQFFLLKPNENTLAVNGYTIPFTLLNETYAFVLDYSKIKTKNRTTYQILDSIISGYIRKYPKLTLFQINKYQNAISLDGLNDKEKKLVLQQIKNDSLIAVAGNVFSFQNNNRYTYCDKNLYVQVNQKDIDSFKLSVTKLGFEYIRPDMSAPYHFISYKSKMLDKDFFEAYKKLSVLPFVLGITLNNFMVAEPEMDLKPF